jgi:hypothetical protein
MLGSGGAGGAAAWVGASSRSDGTAGEKEGGEEAKEEDAEVEREEVEEEDDAGAEGCARGWLLGSRRPRGRPQQPNDALWRERRTARSRQLAAAQAIAIASTTTASPVSTTTIKIDEAGGGGGAPPAAGPTEVSKVPISALRAAAADADADASDVVSPR